MIKNLHKVPVLDWCGIKDKSERAFQASRLNKILVSDFGEEIMESIRKTACFRDQVNLKPREVALETTSRPTVVLDDITTEEAIYKYCKTDDDNSDVGVLNFASYTRFGGGYIKGSIAQEECLCARSTLYPILSFFSSEYQKNYTFTTLEKYANGIYSNFALFSPKVLFFYKPNGFDDGATEWRKCGILTCACPNLNAFISAHNSDTSEELVKARKHIEDKIRERIGFLLDVLESRNTTTLILGAFGCGVFGNDPRFIAEVFSELIATDRYHFKKVIFAIPHSRRDDDRNLKGFREVLSAKFPEQK